jgi:glycosyltransferase involved in cell wall biosynthesis
MGSLGIALFSPYLPAPALSGGRIRIHRLVSRLVELGEVQLFAAASQRQLEECRDGPELRAYSGVHVGRRWFNDVPGLVRPSRVRNARPSALERAFRRAHQARAFDVIVAEHSHAGGVAFEMREVPWVLDEHNIESEYVAARSLAAKRSGFFQRREVSGLERWEQSLWRAADEVVCVSSGDAARIASFRERPPELIPNGVATDEIEYLPPSERDGFEILFVGMMNHPPNVAAARFLAHEVLPLVRRELPQARLILCGTAPTREVSSLAGEHVEVTGTVASVAPFLRRAGVYANAVAQGAGTSLKVLEALAAGVPLVSTAVGVRGFDLTAPGHFLQAEDAATFASALCQCLRERASRDEPARRGRELATTHDWSKVATRFAAVVERAASRRQRNAQKRAGT